MSIKTIFCSSNFSELDTEIIAYCNQYNEIYISISSENSDSSICLDKETAIKFVKHLKKEISFIGGGENGNI